MYSQNDEEAVICKWFARQRGRFLDIGASDGIHHSNTRALAEAGWAGVLCEPSPEAFAKLLANCDGKRELTCVNCALVAGSGRLQTLYASSGEWIGISSLSRSQMECWKPHAAEHGTVFHSMLLRTLSVAELLEVVGAQFDFVSVDAEGHTFNLAGALPWRAIGAQLVCIEHEGRMAELDAIFTPIGYRRIHMTPENTIYGV